MQKDKVISDRKKQANSIKSVMKHLHEQLEDHKSGKKIISNERRLQSLEERIEAYQKQIDDLLRDDLSDDVRIKWIYVYMFCIFVLVSHTSFMCVRLNFFFAHDNNYWLSLSLSLSLARSLALSFTNQYKTQNIYMRNDAQHITTQEINEIIRSKSSDHEEL